MIKRLRLRIVAINVITASIILLIALIITFSAGYGRITAEREKRMTYALTYDAAEDDQPFSENKLFTDIVLVEYNTKTEQAEWYFGSNADLDVEFLKSHLPSIVNGKKDSGMIRMSVNYIRSVEGDVTKVVFNNKAIAQEALRPYLWIVLGALSLGLVGYVIISLLLARIAIDPIEDTWNKQKQFVADASHELKTPLSVIMANTDMLLAHQDETVADQMKWILNTQDEAKRMAELVSDLMFLAKNDDGLQVQMEDVNLSDCVSTVVLGHDAVFYENNKEFSYDIAHNLHINGNNGQLKQLVGILLDNANRYSINSGNIKLKLTSSSKHVTLTVSNDCVQLTDEQLSHLFDRFYTVDPSRNKNNGGNGLGLSIAKIICQTHGGNLRAECNDGRITFTATFPLKKSKG